MLLLLAGWGTDIPAGEMRSVSAAYPVAPYCRSPQLDAINRQLSGTLVDYTNNHGCDNRLFSAILGQPRDLYVYLPPGYSPDRAYSLLLWFHGAFGDEHSFLDSYALPLLDELMAAGTIPPMIVACPDGTYEGTRGLLTHHSFYINGRGGAYEDHVMIEVLGFLESRFPIRPERQAHAMAGISAGGFAAISLCMRHRDRFQIAAGLAAPVNLRVSNDRGKYFKNFRPDRYQWRNDYRPKEIVARYFGIICLRAHRLLDHAFGPREILLENVREYNPADLLFDLDVQPGEVDLYISYPGCDNFNFDAHAESFVWLASQKGITVDVVKDKHARHLSPFFVRNAPSMLWWLGRHVLPPCELVPHN